MSILFDQIIFGPVHSRRFGLSLGINLLPTTYKYCTFDCVYCECGWTKVDRNKKPGHIFTFEEIAAALEIACQKLKDQKVVPDNLTFAGNGEPTIHPAFPAIIDMTLRTRDLFFPDTRVTVLSNATRLHRPLIRQALMEVDHNVLKLDCGTEAMYRLINRPLPHITLQSIVDQLIRFESDLIIQSMFIRGEHEGRKIDNTTDDEVAAWLDHLVKITPEKVMVYSIDRSPPTSSIHKVPYEDLVLIAGKVEKLGIPAEIY
jgi:wyosine [tRNA(Phe)-imidazoG37] synthetase (radical SAM superfamily)